MATRQDNWEAVKALFEAALEQDAASRSSFLKERCPDASVCAEVERLLAEHDQAASFLSMPALSNFPPKADARPLRLSDGDLLAGRFRIVRFIAGGGMGEVYQARDTRLDRTVAIKILHAYLSDKPEAKQRFDREARAISSLSHPNICALYDVGHQDGIDFLVLEFLEGQTLAQRLTRGAVPVDQALGYGVAICDGLERAHRVGVIHRDLKPGNIMLSKAGMKLMDFGLAKAVGPPRPPSGLTSTLTSPEAPLLTAEGMIVGTFHYMSPEQLEGKEADVRSDIFSLGGVLYEMLTGTRAFEGKTTAAVVAAILEKTPAPILRSKPACPESLDRAVRLCLAKDPDERWQTVHDLKLQLQGIEPSGGGSARQGRSSRTWWTRAANLRAFVAAVLLLTSVALGFLLSHRTSKVPGSPAVRALLLPPKDFSFAPFGFALSPDGTKIAFVATSSSQPKGILWAQRLDSTTAQPLAGTEDVADSGYPFWSPDSTKIAFFSEGKLKRVDADGGVVTTLADARGGHGGAWSRDGLIVFGRGTSGNELLYRIPTSGGGGEQITAVDKGHVRDVHRWPSFLPDGHHVFFSCSGTKEFHTVDSSGTDDWDTGCVVDSTSREQLPSESGRPGQYVDGLLLYVASDGNLTAQSFDPSTGAFHGDKLPIAERIARDELLRIDSFSASPRVLAYMSGDGAFSQVVWRNRQGQVVETVEPAGTYDGIALSPDERRVVTSRSDTPDDRYLWRQDVGRGSASLFSDKFAKVGQNRQLVWSKDGSKVAYASTVPQGAIYVTASTGTQHNEENLFGKLPPGAANVPTDFSPDGRLLVYINFTGESGSKLWVHPFAEGQQDYPLLRTDSPEGEAQFSPDGRWLAYVSEASGRPEVYVVAFPGLFSKTQVSIGGGNQPRWRRDGKELFFVAPDGKMTSAAMEARGNILKAGTPQALFQTQITAVSHGFYQYDVTADGQRFVVNTRTEQAVRPITIYVNWDSGIKSR